MTDERPRVLVIEDEPDLRRLLRIVLERGGFEMLEAGDGRKGLKVFHEERPDLLILDIGLPELDGWQVLERVRDVSDVPVLLLTARALEAEKVRALHAGADDYVTKPFGREELVARVHTLLRRARPRDESDKAETFEDDLLTVAFATREVRVRGEVVSLTPTEWRLLAALVRHEGQVLSPDQLLEQAWEDPTGVGRDRVKFAVLRLRRKLGFESDDPRIESVRGFGYRYRSSNA